MKIVAPLTEITDTEVLFNSGADELFFGYIPYSWLNNYFNLLPLNGRERMYANFGLHSHHDLDILCNKLDSDKISMTINGRYYNDSAYKDILELVKYAIGKGIKNYIVADINLVILLRSIFKDIFITISSDAGIYNSEALRFISKYGIKRIIFPRKTPIDNMESIIDKTKDLGIEYEAFILNELCYYCGAFCNAIHCDELLRICRLPKVLVTSDSNICKKENFSKRQSNLSANTDLNGYSLGRTGCGICKIKRLEEIGVTHLKVVGRGKVIGDLTRDINSIRELIDCSDKFLSNKEFESYVKAKFFNNVCPKDCYYME